MAERGKILKNTKLHQPSAYSNENCHSRQLQCFLASVWNSSLGVSRGHLSLLRAKMCITVATRGDVEVPVRSVFDKGCKGLD